MNPPFEGMMIRIKNPSIIRVDPVTGKPMGQSLLEKGKE